MVDIYSWNCPILFLKDAFSNSLKDLLDDVSFCDYFAIALAVCR